MELQNKKVLVTGGSSGIGKAIIHELMQNGVQDILTIPADISSMEDLNRLMAIIIQEWAGLDILVNSAGVVSAGLLAVVDKMDSAQDVARAMVFKRSTRRQLQGLKH